jgi:hypothetical protein
MYGERKRSWGERKGLLVILVHYFGLYISREKAYSSLFSKSDFCAAVVKI